MSFFCRDETLGSARHLHISDKFCHYVILFEKIILFKRIKIKSVLMLKKQ